MAYSKKELENKALEILKKDKDIVFIEDLCVSLGVGKTTFYAHKLNESNDIKNAILVNKQTIKKKLRIQWFKSTSPVLQLALYKLLSNEEELNVLNNSEYHKDDKTESVDFEYTEVK